MRFPGVDEATVAQFHTLSNAIPRVQSYALARVSGVEQISDYLLPNGKSLADVLNTTFQDAYERHGSLDQFKRFLSALDCLPAPANVDAVAAVTGVTAETVRDVVTDLWPGLRVRDDIISIADEDFEQHIHEEAATLSAGTTQFVANYFSTTCETSAYSAVHVADILIKAQRGNELLAIIERDPTVAALTDPIARRQVQLRRLKLSVQAYAGSANTVDTLKALLLSAEADRDETTINAVLHAETDLAVEFGGPSFRRQVLLDRDRIRQHGSFLIHDAARAARAGITATAHEQYESYRAWLKRRMEQPKEDWEKWGIEPRDLAAFLEVIVALEGADAALTEILGWTPRFLPLIVADILIPQLLASGRIDVVRSFLANDQTRHPWSLALMVPLALAGAPPDRAAVGEALKMVGSRAIPNPERFNSYQASRWRENFFNTLVAGCELGYLVQVDGASLAKALSSMLKTLEGKRALLRSDFHRIDGLIRCWLLTRLAAGESHDVKSFMAYVEEFTRKVVPKTKEDAPQSAKTRGRSAAPVKVEPKSSVDADVTKRIHAVFAIYEARARVLTSGRNSEAIAEADLDGIQSLAANAYAVDYDYDSAHLRGVVAQSVILLQMVPGVSTKALLERATRLSVGRFDDWFASKLLPLWQVVKLRTSEAADLVQAIGACAATVRAEAAPSTEKVEALVRLSRLLVHVSRDDAAPLFNEAISIAKELDREAIDQIDFLARCASQARYSDHAQSEVNAGRVFVFTSGAAERLRNAEGFPWNSAIDALVSLDFPSAVAAVSRWADEGLVSLERTLPRLLETALEKGLLQPEVASALSLLLRHVEADFDSRVGKAAAVAAAGRAELAEEVAKDVLLIRRAADRLDRGRSALLATAKADHAGYWITELGKMVSFLEQMPRKAREASYDESADIVGRAPDERPKPFEVQINGAFASAAAIETILRSGRDSDQPFSERDTLRAMMEASSHPRDRVAFLNALCEVDDGLIWSNYRAQLLKAAIEAWSGTPAIGAWVRQTLPGVIARKLSTFIQYFKEGESLLPDLLQYADTTPSGQQSIILNGVIENSGNLSGRTLFAVAELLCGAFDPNDAAALLDWYAPRLVMRIPAQEHAAYDPTDIPHDGPDAVARFLFAQLSDIDTRIRWRAAHALRRIARLGLVQIVDSIVLLTGRTHDTSFRDPSAPFYALAAKLWLAIALYRISAETPSSLRHTQVALLHLATDPELPHVAIREYAKRALELLVQTGTVVLARPELSVLANINIAKKGRTPASNDGPSGRYAQRAETGCVFKFDEMDTVPYWYDYARRLFPGVSHAVFLKMAEQWIMQKWGAPAEANYWNTEPRKGRYDERRFNNYTHSHGSLPVLERYGTHLEWHAMQCVVGELLETNPVAEVKYDYESERFENWLGSNLPTDPPSWISDLRGPTPLETGLWQSDERADIAWTRAARSEEFIKELGLGKVQLRPGWIVVDGDYSTSIGKRQTDVRIASALVSSSTAAALTNALNTMSNAWSFKIPDEDDDLQIDAPPYRLLGWINGDRRDSRFDDRDPFRFDVRNIRSKPGKLVSTFLRLEQRGSSQVAWVSTKTGDAAFLYEAWSDEPNDDERRNRRDRTEGWRLWARVDAVASFLIDQALDLLCEVELERRIEKEYSSSHETERKGSFHKAVCFRADGTIDVGERRIGTWAGLGRKFEAGGGQRHARQVDGAPPRRANGKSKRTAKRQGKKRS